jgi:hypothetical protein
MSENIENKTANLEELLTIISRASEVFSYEVFIPSLGKNVMFREMNTSQQKRIVKAVIDSPVYNTEFIFALRQIMKENCTDPQVDIDTLNLLDKLYIALKMRAISIGNQIEIKVKCPSCGKELSRGIGLLDVLERIQPPAFVPKAISDEKGIFTAHCSMPTIGTEYKLEEELRKNVRDVSVRDAVELRKMVGDAFIGELAKHINQIDIKKEDDTVMRIPLDSLSFHERIALIERLPRKLSEKVVDYINEVTESLDKVILLDFVCDKCFTAIKEGLKINSGFFTRS